jgi:hypothetical protein
MPTLLLAEDAPQITFDLDPAPPYIFCVNETGGHTVTIEPSELRDNWGQGSGVL